MSIISRSIASPKIPCKSSRPSTKKSIIPTLRSVSKTSSIGIHDAKGAHFNGAYYGAPQGVTVPPPHAYHRPPRGRGCGPCCILTTLLKLVITIMVILGIAALVAWLILHPNKVKFYYNLQLDISIRNPNKKIGICYDKVDAMAYYEGERFSWASLPAFYQGHKNTTGTSEGFFYIDVKLYLRSEIECDLRISLRSNSTTELSRKRCDIDYW
ncbi:hypothetical protein AMTRI_Chr11g95460 [Amborella trichopoda]